MTTEMTTQLSPAPLSEAYQKARRNLALFSGVLIVWEYLGLSFGGESSGARIKLPGDLALSVQHPEVVPVVIVILVAYFAVRLSVEWHQCDVQRRLLPASRFDVACTYFLAAGSIVLFTLQQVTAFRLGDILTQNAVSYVMSGYGAIYFFRFYNRLLAKYDGWPRAFATGRFSTHGLALLLGITLWQLNRSFWPSSSFTPTTTEIGVFIFTVVAHWIWWHILWNFIWRGRRRVGPSIGGLVFFGSEFDSQTEAGQRAESR